MTRTELLAGIAAMQRVQAANPPSSEKWQRASRVLHELATKLNGGIAPKEACGRLGSPRQAVRIVREFDGVEWLE
jgi:hypothetical protein